MVLDAERRAVVGALADLARLTPATSGNLSARRNDRFAVTPTGMSYDDIAPDDVPVLTLDGEQVWGERAPSSETAMHLGLYRELDAGAVVHTHSPWATTLAVLGEPVRPVHYAVAQAGGEVPVAEYATYGTPELAANVVDAVSEAGTTACLIANHGLVAAGADVPDAIETARAVESTARLYCQAAAVGDPQVLSADEIATVAEKFQDYGQSG